MRKAAERLFSRKALLLSGAVAGVFMCPTAALASFEYVTHWATFNPSVGGTAHNKPTDVAFLKSNGNLLIVDGNTGNCTSTNLINCSTVGNAPPLTAGGVVIQQTDGAYVGLVTPNNNSGPTRAAVAPGSGDVYIGTYDESKVRRYTEAGGALTLANTWIGCTANGGNGPYTWNKAFGVAVDSTGAIYVTDDDSGNKRIIKMNSAGQCLAAPLTTYTKNGAPGQVFQNITDLAVDSANNLVASSIGDLK